MKSRNITILVLLLLVADQILKIWIKTHMTIGESITVFHDWFQLRFIENNGAAFGMHIASGSGLDWGKLALSLFRVVMVVAPAIISDRPTITPFGVSFFLLSW